METHDLIAFVKALADADRLRIVGVLAQQPARAIEMAEELSLPPQDVHKHLASLEEAGIVHQEQGLFNLDDDGLEKLARRQFEGRRPAFTPDPDLEAKRRKVLAAYLNPDGTIKQIPQQGAKLTFILDHIIAAFSPGASYTEKEVNMVLARFNRDVSSLRRYLVDAGMLGRERDGSRYWRPE
jgi:hypothetical protein